VLKDRNLVFGDCLKLIQDPILSCKKTICNVSNYDLRAAIEFVELPLVVCLFAADKRVLAFA
jgi:hypothetical protein